MGARQVFDLALPQLDPRTVTLDHLNHQSNINDYERIIVCDRELHLPVQFLRVIFWKEVEDSLKENLKLHFQKYQFFRTDLQQKARGRFSSPESKDAPIKKKNTYSLSHFKLKASQKFC